MYRQPTMVHKLAAEFLGTALLVLIGPGSVVATLTLAAGSKAPFSEADLLGISFAFGFIIMALVYTIGGISGCQINPAISLGLAVTGRQSWGTTFAYIVAQAVGGVVGALGIAAIFGSNAYLAGGAGITSFASSTPALTAAIAEAIGTFILAFTVAGIALDQRAPTGWAGLVIGMVVVGIILLVGPVTNASLNPARSFGPTMAAFLVSNGGTNHFSQLWVYIVGPIVGGVLGVVAYDFLGRPRPVAAIPAIAANVEVSPAEAQAKIATATAVASTAAAVAAEKKAPAMKKLINTPESVVADELAGIAAAHPQLVRVDFANQIIVRADAPKAGKVGLVSGGGSGHEPLHGGFVGRGMLDAACPGAVFTSPVPDQMLAATRAVNGGAGVLHIVKNYTGDVLNFELAAELAQGEGIQAASVVVDDDVAVKDSLYTAGRRGVGGTVLLEKIVGGAAEQGMALDQLVTLAKKVNANVRSMGMALTSCTVPSAGKPTFDLGDDEMEIGIGIHGEPGRTRMKLRSAAEIAQLLVNPILDDLPFKAGDQVLAFVNGMGGSPLIELYIMYNEVAKILRGRQITIARNLVGNYITSLEMAGTSVTLLRLDDEMTRLWDAPVYTAALRWGV
jgi:dihydroxyacetone kinase-like protein